MRITMTQTRMGESGSLLTSGSTETVSDAFGAVMVGAGYATDTDGALTPPDSQPIRLSSDGSALVSGDGNVLISFVENDPLIGDNSRGTLITQWTGSTYAVGATTEFAKLPPDTNAGTTVNLVGNAADGVYAEKTSLAVDTTGLSGIGLWVQGPIRTVNPASDMVPLRLYMGVAGYTNAINAFITVPADGAWHFVYCNAYQFSVNGSFAYGNVVDRIRLRVADASDATASGFTRLSAGESCYVGPVYINPRTRPKFMIRIDDGLSDVVIPDASVNTILADGTPAPTGGWSHERLLDHYGFPASLFVLARRIGTSNTNKTFLTWEQLDALKAKNWAICLQTFFDPVDAINSGMRLLGPTGYLNCAVTSVDTAANTITATLNHNISSGTVYWGYPVLFTGANLPSPLALFTVYWARYVSASAFTLHPTENDAIAGTNTIDITTTGTAANFFFHYAPATNDYLGAKYDFEAGMQMLSEHGYVDEAKHCALNQGSLNFDIAKAAAEAGITHLYAALYSTVAKTHLANAAPMAIASGTYPLVPLTPEVKLMGGIQTDASGMTTADVDSYLASLLVNGGWAQNFHHALNNPNTLILAHLLASLRILVNSGALDVVIATDFG